MNNDCIFCKIIKGELPSTVVYEDEHILAFRDIYPQAPVHILIIPKEHIESVADINAENSHLVAKCFEAIKKIADDEGLGGNYRIITNTGAGSGQTVFHIHFHLLGGKQFSSLVS